MSEEKGKTMKKAIIIAGILFVLVASALACTVLYQGDLAHITMTVKPPTVNFVSTPIQLDAVDSLQSFNILSDPPGKELIVRNISLPHLVIYPTNLTGYEKAALYDCNMRIKIYNETTVLLDDTIDALAETQIQAENPCGDWDVMIQVYGQAGVPNAEQAIDFDVIIELNPNEVLILPQTQNVSIGETFDVSVYVIPHEDIAGMQFDLSFNKSVVHVNSVTEGDFFKRSGIPTLFSSGTIDNDAGFVNDVYGTILGAGSVSTPGIFAHLNLTVVGEGNTCLNLTEVKLASPEPVNRRPAFISSSSCEVTA